MFPSHSTPNRYPPRGGSFQFHTNNQSPGRFSPRHPSDVYSHRQNFYSPRSGSNQYSPRNPPNMGSPVNNPNKNYSPNPNSSLDSPHRKYPSSSPQYPYWNKRSFNNSRNSSEFYSSGNSSFNDSRGSPHGNRMHKHKGGDGSGKGYNIRNYINPSMLENPWAELEKKS